MSARVSQWCLSVWTNPTFDAELLCLFVAMLFLEEYLHIYIYFVFVQRTEPTEQLKQLFRRNIFSLRVFLLFFSTSMISLFKDFIIEVTEAK